MVNEEENIIIDENNDDLKSELDSSEKDRLKKDRLIKAWWLWIIWWTSSLIVRILWQDTSILTWIEAWIKQWWYTFVATLFTLKIYQLLKDKQISPTIANSFLSAFSLWANNLLQQNSWWTIAESIAFWSLTFAWILIHENEDFLKEKVLWTITVYKKRVLDLIK